MQKKESHVSQYQELEQLVVEAVGLCLPMLHEGRGLEAAAK